MMHHPVDGRGGGHGVEMRSPPRRPGGPSFVAFGDDAVNNRLFGALGAGSQVIEKQEVESSFRN